MLTIAYACDANYAPLTAISAVSAITHNPGSRILLLGYGLEPDAQRLVQTRVERIGGKFLYLDVTPSVSDLKKKGYSGYTSYAAYARIFIANLLQESGRVIYLDCDTLVCDSLSPLVSTDMHGLPFALSGDCVLRAYKKYIGHPLNLPYYNSGVMLIDLDGWRRCHCTERILNELANPHGPNPLGDQDVIVRCFPNETAQLPPKWNFLSQYFMVSFEGLKRIVGEDGMLSFSRKEYLDARKHAAVYHFSGNTMGRPWYTSSRHPMRAAYIKAANDAGLPEVAEQTRPMKFEYKLQYFLYKMLPQWMFDVVCFWMYKLHIKITYRT